MKEYNPPHENVNLIHKWSEYGGVKFPKFLVTEAGYQDRLRRYNFILEENRIKLKEGTANEDAGDSHGQFHNELAWRREQEIVGNAKLAAEIGSELPWSIRVPDLPFIRDGLHSLDIHPETQVTLTSKVTLKYLDDNDEMSVVIVPLFDGGFRNDWISVESQLAKSIGGKSTGEEVNISSVEDRPIMVRLINIE